MPFTRKAKRNLALFIFEKDTSFLLLGLGPLYIIFKMLRLMLHYSFYSSYLLASKYVC